MLSGTYEFLPQDRVIFGRPSAEAVVETADRMAKRRLLIVASKTLSRKTDVVSKVQATLAERCVGVFDECVEHMPRASVLSLAAVVRKGRTRPHRHDRWRHPYRYCQGDAADSGRRHYR